LNLFFGSQTTLGFTRLSKQKTRSHSVSFTRKKFTKAESPVKSPIARVEISSPKLSATIPVIIAPICIA
jgi:hypothetical protein